MRQRERVRDKESEGELRPTRQIGTACCGKSTKQMPIHMCQSRGGGRKEERGVGGEGAKRLAMSSGIRDSKA